jgi:hypothetical protein
MIDNLYNSTSIGAGYPSMWVGGSLMQSEFRSKIRELTVRLVDHASGGMTRVGGFQERSQNI